MEIIEDLKKLPKEIALLIVCFMDTRSISCIIFKDFLGECQKLDFIIRQFYHNESTWYMNRDVTEILLFEINLFKTLVQKRTTYKKACFLSRYYLARYFARGGIVPQEYEYSNSYIALRRYCAMYTRTDIYMPQLFLR